MARHSNARRGAFTLAAALCVALGCQRAPAPSAPSPAAVKAPAEAAPPAAETPPSETPPTTPQPPPRAKGCTVEGVRAVVQPHREDVTRCYRSALQRNANAGGRLEVELHIDRGGTAKFLGVQGDTFGDQDFTRCVFGVLKPLPYPIPETEPCVVVYPFVLSAG